MPATVDIKQLKYEVIEVYGMRDVAQRMFGRKTVKRKSSGFTIIEFVIIVALMAILAGILTPMFYGSQEGAKQAKAKSETDALAQALRSYFGDEGDFKKIAALDEGERMKYLADLGYLPEVRSDPWGGNYRIVIDNWNITNGRPGPGSMIYAECLGKDADDTTDDIRVYVFNIPTTTP